jgi:signal transduction histidine kinase
MSVEWQQDRRPPGAARDRGWDNFMQQNMDRPTNTADSGTETARPRRLNLNESVRQACEQLTVLASDKGLDLRYQTQATPVSLSADPAHLERLWLILLDNAIKYTPGGGKVEDVVHTSGRGSPVFEVGVTGVGISEADLPHIFEALPCR